LPAIIYQDLHLIHTLNIMMFTGERTRRTTCNVRNCESAKLTMYKVRNENAKLNICIEKPLKTNIV